MFPIDLYMFLNLEVYEVSCLLIWGRCWSNLVGRLQFFPRVCYIWKTYSLVGQEDSYEVGWFKSLVEFFQMLLIFRNGLKDYFSLPWLLSFICSKVYCKVLWYQAKWKDCLLCYCKGRKGSSTFGECAESEGIWVTQKEL